MAQAGLEARLGTHVRTECSAVAAAKTGQADNNPFLDFPSDSGASLLTPGLSLSLTSALSHPALLCLCLPSPCLPLLPSLGSGKNTAHFSFSWFSADMGAAPALCQDFPLAREPTSPNSLPSGAS